jgi:hypothetical protein
MAMKDRFKNIGPTAEYSLRVSVATLSRVVFPRPEDGVLMLALEKKATMVSGDKGFQVTVRAQPFGGAIRILNLKRFLTHVDSFNYDSERSHSEQDFRVYIRPSTWEAVREYCLRNLGQEDNPDLESDPSRELVEEFDDTMGIQLRPDQYTVDPIRTVVESLSIPAANMHATGNPTARIYRIYEVRILDPSLWRMMMTYSEMHPCQVLRRLAIEDARDGGQGRANSMLVAPVEQIRDAYLAIPPEMRGTQLSFENTLLAGNVAAVLDGIFLPKYWHSH